MFSSKRQLWMKMNVAEALHLKESVVEECFRQDKNTTLIQEFLTGKGSSKLFFYYQVQDSYAQDDAKDSNFDANLFISNGENERLKEKAVYFYRTVAPDRAVNLNEASDSEVLFGEISPNTIVQLNSVICDVYNPMIQKLEDGDWGKCDAEQRKEFETTSSKFATELEEALKSLNSGLDICKLDHENLATITNENEKLAYYEDCFDRWITAIKSHLDDDTANRKEPPDAGPETELIYWRSRMQKITSLNEQLKTKDFNTVKTALTKHRTLDQSAKAKTDDKIAKLMHDFNDLDVKITDKLNEARDNVKYLTTLEKFIEPLYIGTPQQIIETLPALMNAIKMIYTIARYYNTSMTTLFVKITNQMITNCKSQIQEPRSTDKIWTRDPEELIAVLRSCISLNHAYQEQYRITKEKVADLPKGRYYDFNEIQIFGKFNLFCGRLNKLIDIFSTIQQFNALSKHNLEGMKTLINNFKALIDKFRQKRYDLLDYQNIKFDRDFVQFNHEISQLDDELTIFIDSNFTKSRNIEYSLKLLKRFQSILKRDALRHNLSNKYESVLNSYATELQEILTKFQDMKGNPPILRNMPLEAGKIIWVKHLFAKITGPIHIFQNTSVNLQQLKKYYGLYNNLGKQLTVYEMWYLENWKEEIKKATASLQATLIIFDEKPNRFIVNFDRVITQLIREAKCLDRNGCDIPENARIILLQEDKFKNYYDELQYLLREYERITGKIKPINKTLLGPHIQDLILKLRPGMVTLTWTSMNIEAYIHHVHQGLQKLEQLIIGVNDIIENRIENNLKSISKVLLVDLPQESKPLSLEEFVELQEKYIKSKTEYLMSKNVEVEHAVDDLLQTILLYPLDPHVDPVSSEETKRIKRYYIWYLYQALLNSTQNSLNAMKYRVCGRRNQGNQANQQQLKPFFEVDIQLEFHVVKLNPNLDEIQKAINRAATAVLRCSKNLYSWDQQDKDNDKKGSFYEMIAQEKEIVKVILLLTGSIQGTKNKVNEFLASFSEFDWLWSQSISDNLKDFNKKQPTLRDYEEKLKLFNQTEEAIDKIENIHKIGAMALKTEFLKIGLKRWVNDWKNSFSADLRKRATEKMQELIEHTKILSAKLAREVKDIDSLGFVMEALEEIRQEQAEIDLKFGPVNEMFELLNSYPQAGSAESNDMDERAKLKIDWESLIKQAEIKQKELQQTQSSYLKKLKTDVKGFIGDVVEFRKDYDVNGPMAPNIGPKDAIERLRRFEDEYSVRKRVYKINKKGENLFGLKNQKYPSLQKTKSELKNLKQLYSLYASVNEEIIKWKERSWVDLSVEMLNEMQESIQKYGDQCIRLPKDLKEWNAYKELKLEIDNFKEILPLIISLKKPSIKPRHWQQINTITGRNINYEHEESFYLQDLIEAKLLDFKEDMEDICDSADKQLKIENSLEEIRAFWENAFFEFSKGKRDYYCMLAGVKVQEIKERLDEDQMTLATLNAMRQVTPFAKVVQEKQAQLSDVAETLDMWVKTQMLWSSLEPVFTGGDIAKQMPLEAKKFNGIDKNWSKVMEKAVETKKCVACCQNDVLKSFLPLLIDGLESCQKSLEKYLEGKRKLFPRFYFVSNQVLLKILSQGSDPASIRDELSLLFDAISKMQIVKLDKKAAEMSIVDIRSTMADAEEIVELNQPVKCEGNIEGWLKKLEVKMQETLHDIARHASNDCSSGTQFKAIVETYCSQIALLACQLLWTAKINDALEKKNEKAFMDKKKAEIAEMFQVLRLYCMRDDLNPIIRTKIETLVTIHVHQVDITNELKCKDVNDFDWQKQTRLYWKLDTIVISITDWDGYYSYEYLGAKERLCITPLTDRCYITLAQAMSMYYGGAPAGPAGTGKTETVKDMGRTLGVYVVVTNCSDQHRYRDMAKIFKGLCQSGLWGCFDEFNRIDLEVLSVVAQQVGAITAAKKAHLKKFNFPGEPELIELVDSVGYFITMNPGYAGRQELPENLKVLFRGVTMMVPDREIIIKVKLASYGYDTYNNLAKKFKMLYGLCEEQLSKQRHYDFGLRNILSVLRTAGNTKRSAQTADEEMLLMRTLRDMNLSKLVADDVPLFNSLLKDIFPKQQEPQKMVYADVERKISEILQKKNLLQQPEWVLKIVQLYETSLVRHGFMMVGPTGTGKTTIMEVLTAALSEVKISHKMTRMNPKAITNKEMYGVKSEMSDDWIPGVFSEIWKKCNARSNKYVSWIVCDGPVDAIWIENLNTVLDDNKILTLASGERTPMSENCKLVFEVENLNNASPATVSRCGIVFVSSTDLGYEPVYKGWVIQRKEKARGEETEKLLQIFNKYLSTMKIIENVETICKNPVMDISPVIKVSNLLNLVTGMLGQPSLQGRTLTDQDYEKIVVWCMSWAVGGIYESKDRLEFHEFLSGKGVPLPPKGRENETIFEYVLDIDSRSGSLEWKMISPEEWRPPEKVQFSQLLLPTLDSTRAEVLIKLIADQQRSSLCSRSVLLVGGSGTAKTSTVLMYSTKFKREVMLFKRINFSSATQPSSFQESIETECDTKAGMNFVPPGNKLMTVFIDDVSMPFVNEWGDQITLEIVRQLIENGGFYWLEKTRRGDFKAIMNLQYIGAMNHPGGGRNDVPNRLKRHFFIFNMIPPNNVDSIFGSIIKHQFKPKYFSNEFNKVAEGLTNATLKIWNKVKIALLPTPNKFHYIFNLRDLSRIFKGVLQTRKEVIQSSSTVGNLKPEIFLIALWRHECERVFVDKLINQKDKDLVYNFIQDVSLEAFSQHESEIMEKISKDKPLYFCDFLRRDVINEDGIVEVEAERVYESIQNIEDLRARVQELLDFFNKTYPAKKMSLVLFDDALKHLLRISRIIKLPRSSALLVGIGGSGKQSLTRLAAYIGRNITYQIKLTKNFGEKELKEELKTLCDFSGHMGKPTTFIMTDAEVKNENFLEFINMILSTGEIPGLIAKDEREAWLGDVRTPYMKEKGLSNVDPPQAEIYQYFIDRLRDNLHIVLCFSPVGMKFRERARKFPALFNECTIDWFLPWPEEALVSVAEEFIERFKDLDTKPEVRLELPKHMGNVHLMVNTVCDIFFAKMRRQVYVTPKSFLSFINSYKSVYIKKYYEELDVQEKSFKIGLQKIQDAAVDIQKMSIKLKDEEVLVRESQDKTEILLRELEKENKKAQAKEAEVEADATRCLKSKEEILIEKDLALKDLQQAMPALKRAQQAVAEINQPAITEVKKIGTPQAVMKYAMDCVAIILGTRLNPVVVESAVYDKKKNKEYPFLKDSWDLTLKDILNDMRLLDKLKDPQLADTLNEETIELLSPYLAQEEEFLNEAQAERASQAVKKLLGWVYALNEYYEKSKIVKPKMEFLTVQEGRLEVAENALAAARAELAEVKKITEELRQKSQKQMEEKNALEDRSRRTKNKINQAKKLIESLSGEKDRWTKGRDEITEQKRRLVGNVSMACAFISYCGPFNAEFRSLLVNEYFVNDMKKRSIPVTPGLNLTEFLVDDATVSEWNLQGLPKDELSIQNGILVTNSTRFPLLIDPQGQGQAWIKNKFADSIDQHRGVTTLANPKFKDKFLGFALEEGKTLIVEGIENEVDPMLDPVLERQVTQKGKTIYVEVAGTEFCWNIDFRMFMTCRLANPLFSPELSAKTTIIDFTVTQTGLEQQLLGRVLSKEQKALEESLNTLLAEVTQNKKDLQRLDKSLLQKLSDSKGDLLEDTELVEVLNTTKTQASEVTIKLADAEIKTKEINEKREQYRPVAIRGSVLYFCIIETSLINWMYNSSLGQFLKLFDYSIDNSEKAQTASKRVDIIIRYLTYHVYRYVNRGLFERDKVTFILMVCFKIMITDGKLGSNDVSYFLKSGAALDVKAEKSKPVQWLQGDKVWLNILALSRHQFADEHVPFFKDLPDLLTRSDAWKIWIEKNDPENAPVPDFQERISQDKELGPFIHLCLVRSLREDRTLIAATMFINNKIGKEFTAPVTDTLESIWAESSPSVPVLYLLSAGADPTSSVEEFAKKKKRYPCSIVSMGEGQDKYADEGIKVGLQSGQWVILQNCHLGLKYMEELDNMLTGDLQSVNPDFRLWITCEPHNKFPLGLLQKGIKVTNEPPKGLKAGLYKTFTTVVNQDFLDKIDHPNWRSLIYTVCFLHSVVQERRKFGSLGWCVPYEYNNSDLEASMNYIEKYLNNFVGNTPNMSMSNLPISFIVIIYMVCDVQYGGRITDDLDRELFQTYGHDWLKEAIFGDFTFAEIGGDPKDKTIDASMRFKYKIPNPQGSSEIKRYIDYIESMPSVDSPEVFGLHANADLTFRNKESLEMIGTIMETRPKDSSAGGGKTREEQVQDKVRELLSKLPVEYVENQVKVAIRGMSGPKQLQEKGMALPLNVFLFQEIQRMQRVLSLVRKTFVDLIDAIDGIIILTPFLLDAMNAIFDAKVPSKWLYDPSGAEISWLLPTLGSWFGSLIERNNQLSGWLKSGRPQTYWLTGFFNPQGFLTAMKQEVTRMHKGNKQGGKDTEAWSLDDVSYYTQVKEKEYEMIKDIQSEGVYITGLSLEGCRWNRNNLDESEPKKMFAPLPILYVTAQNNKKKPDADKMSASYNCPVYKYPRRTDKYLIFRVPLNCEGTGPNHWKLRGVALLCSTE